MQSITQIQLYGQAQGILTTDNDTAFPLNFAISDIRDISKKTGSYSKSIKIPGTKENNRLLNFYFDVNIQSGTFDINHIQSCAVIQNGILILDNMIMQLVSVDKDQLDNNYEEHVTYTVLIKDLSGDLYTKIGNKYLTDLSNITGVTTTLTFANIIDSWRNNTALQGWKFAIPFHSNDGTNFDPSMEITAMQPAIYAKWYMDKIFGDAGFSYNWPELVQNKFDKLIIPYNGDAPKTSQLDDDNALVYVQRTTTTIDKSGFNNVDLGTGGVKVMSLYNGTGNLLNCPIELQDLQNLWTFNNTFNVQNISTLNNLDFEVELDYTLFVNNPNAFTVYYDAHKPHQNIPNAQANVGMNLQVTQVDNQVGLANARPVTINLTIGKPFPTGVTPLSAGTASFGFTASGVKPNTKIQLFNSIFATATIDGTAVDASIFHGFYQDNPLAGANNYFKKIFLNVDVQASITGVRLKIRSLNDVAYGFNLPIRLINFIPQKIKQSDFLKSIFKMYNIYAEIDKTNPKQLNLKTRDDYYDSGEVVDWTSKVAKDKEQNITFLPDLHNKKVLFTYKNDENDVANKFYFDNTKEVWGQQEFTFDNDYTSGIDTQELIFGATPMYKTSFGAVTPLINGYAPKTLPKILIDGGNVNCNNYMITQKGASATTGTNTGFTLNFYAYMGHWDRPVNPTFDINFGLNDYYTYVGYGSLTNNNLFNNYWRRTVNLINTGKLMSCYLNLNEGDIQKLKLNAKVRIDNSWWNINKIIDYDCNSTKPTKVELISIDDNLKIPFQTRPVTTLNGLNPRITRPVRISFPTTLQHSNLNLTNQYTNVFGFGNIIYPRATVGGIWGLNNIISDDAFIVGNSNTSTGKSVIFGTNNRVTGDSQDGIVIIGNNIDGISANTLYTNNIVISSGYTLNGVAVGQEILRGLTMVLSTGAYFFSGITVSSPSTFSVGEARGYIVDTTDPFNVTANEIIYSGETGLTTPFISAASATYIMLNTGATLTLLSTQPTLEQRRQNIFLGSIGHPTGTLTGVGNRLDFSLGALSQVRDMFNPIKYINENVTTFPFTGLSFANSSGRLYGLGIGYITNGSLNPSSLFIAPASPVTFQYRTQSGGTFSNTTQIIPASYDVAGVVTPVGGGGNTSTNQRIYLLENGSIRIQFGQTTYPTLTEAIAAASTEPFTTFSNNRDLGILIGILSLKRSTTDLNTAGDARFLAVTKFGESFAAGAGVANGNLQTAYNNSAQPQIITTAPLGSIQFRGWDGASNLLLELQNSAGLTTSYFTEGGGFSATSITATTYTNIPYWTAGTSTSSIVHRNTLGQNFASGSSAVATGLNSRAGGQNSFSMNENTYAQNRASLAGGESTFAGGRGSVVFGNQSSSTTAADYSFSIGQLTVTNNLFAVAVGNQTRAYGNASFAEGFQTSAATNQAHAEGSGTLASGLQSHAEGQNTRATGDQSHAEGTTCISSGISSHAEGFQTIAGGGNAHAEGGNTRAFGANSHAEGNSSITSGNSSHAEGVSTFANGQGSHSEGNSTSATTSGSHAEGQLTFANANNAHAEGSGTTANGSQSHAEGQGSIASGLNSHAEGFNTQALGTASHSEGSGTTATRNGAHAEGSGTTASGTASHAEGYLTIAGGTASHAEGNGCVASGGTAHAEGFQTFAIGNQSHAEGAATSGTGVGSHAEGVQTLASNQGNHAEGNATIASGTFGAHAEGNGSIASGQSSHAEGDSIAGGAFSHSEGFGSQAIGDSSHAEGGSFDLGEIGGIAFGEGSHAEGIGTTANGDFSHAEGYQTSTSSSASHAEGISTRATGLYSHAEGQGTSATTTAAHSEGTNTRAGGANSHAGGQNSTTLGAAGFVHGINSSAGTGSAIIVLGSSITGLTANTTYVDRFNIKTIPVGTIVNNLGYDVNGNVIVGSSGSFSGGTVPNATTFSSLLTANGGIVTSSINASVYTNLPLWSAGSGTNAISQKFGGNVASGTLSIAEGSGTTASGNWSNSVGVRTIASDTLSYAGGYGTFTTNVGEWARSSVHSGLTAQFNAQYGIIDDYLTTTDATLSLMNIIVVPNNTGIRVSVTMIARNRNTGAVKEFQGLALTRQIGGTNAMVGGTHGLTSTYSDASMSTASASFGFQTGGLSTTDINVTGIAGQTIDWYCKIDYLRTKQS